MKMGFKFLSRSFILSFFLIILMESFSSILVNYVFNENLEKEFPKQLKSINDTYNFWSDKIYHPYLTYERKKSVKKVDSRAIRIGIVGGSVAEEFALFLDESGKATYQGRPVEFVKLAVAGYRQPQQLIQTVLYTEKADMFISIEGYNEALDFHYSCLPSDWSFASHNFGNMDSSIYKLLTFALKYSIGALVRLSSHINTAKLIVHRMTPSLIDNYFRLSSNHVESTRQNCSKSEYESIMQERFSYGRLKKFLSRSKGFSQIANKKHFVFFQPSHYISNSKPLSEEEEGWVKNNKYRVSTEKKIVHARETYRTVFRGSQYFLDLTSIFKNTKETTYRDSCCHLNSLGNHIMLTYVFGVMGIKWRYKPAMYNDNKK